jgi:GrpB-like predicted nucleotidyltransferase (UPF0157 family)
MIGLKRGVVKVLRYNPKWLVSATKEMDALKKILNSVAFDIQHIGSTAIPGMNAKPIIDIDVAVKSLRVVKDLIGPLKKLGYRYRIGEPRKRLFVKGPNEKITHHLHVIEWGSDLWDNDLLFRDFIRRNKKEAKQYSELKKELASQFSNNRESYSDGKKDFIETILVRAKNSRGHRSKFKKCHGK